MTGLTPSQYIAQLLRRIERNPQDMEAHAALNQMARINLSSYVQNRAQEQRRSA